MLVEHVFNRINSVLHKGINILVSVLQNVTPDIFFDAESIDNFDFRLIFVVGNHSKYGFRYNLDPMTEISQKVRLLNIVCQFTTVLMFEQFDRNVVSSYMTRWLANTFSFVFLCVI